MDPQLFLQETFILFINTFHMSEFVYTISTQSITSILQIMQNNLQTNHVIFILH
jgi:hypothetical protein